MSRLSIELSPKQHQQIKAMAVIAGKSIKDLVLDKVLGANDNDQEAALKQLMQLIDTRIESAENGNISDKSISDIIGDTLKSDK